METGAFIHSLIKSDLGEDTHLIKTRFPPEPNGYLHIGNMKAVFINYGMAALYGGTFNLRFDDTNPVREDAEYVESIKEDIMWMGFDWGDRLFFGSDYFDICYEGAIKLIKKGKAFVCDLSAEKLREMHGTLTAPGKESPYRSRSVKENIDLFERMKNGEFPDGARSLRAKIDMTSPNMNMRDPVIYRISHAVHHNTGNKWRIYPMYDFAHPIQDAVEKITQSMCSLEFEDHRPLYNWVIDELEFDPKPRQIEFAKMYVTNTVMGKRYLRRLVETRQVDGWDDPRMVTISGMRRRGYASEALVKFLDITGVSKSVNNIEFAMLEHCVRENLKPRAKAVMAVLDPLKLTIVNYPEGQTENFEIENNPENPEMGVRSVPFSRELYIEREDYMENAPSKYHRLSEGREVRLKGAYFVTCTGVLRDGNGNVTEVLCSYDPETRSGSGFTGRKVKGTIQWVNRADAVRFTANLYDVLVHDDPESPDGVSLNPDSLIVMENCAAEPSAADAGFDDRFQFIRNGYFCLDSKTSKPDAPVFNRIVSLKSSYKG
ncbi:MAG: glutamine--tRNA ligase/YqeY domain fusion protein [Defluviitaleaceae bacterium]|nr:glutamine--tRNA ligase/YqeY domain fusion protein [Defluviitaleaceae bacterium]MCL2835677.1 glutamine--tRNA ligase/YqeY domain fusion protein [Defluviitaleaceae bacterium]